MANPPGHQRNWWEGAIIAVKKGLHFARKNGKPHHHTNRSGTGIKIKKINDDYLADLFIFIAFMKKWFLRVVKINVSLFIVLLNPVFAKAGAPTVHISPKPTWLSTCKAYDQMPSLRTIQGGYFFELVEHQVQVEKQADYHHLVRRIVSNNGIQNGSEISVSFDPAFETLEFHQITVWRDNKPQNRLKASAFKVLADEKELSNFIYQGSYSALCILDDIRKGDRIEYAYTVTGRNPIFRDKYCDFLYFQFSQHIEHQYTALICSSQRKLHIKACNKISEPKVTEANGLKRYEWEDFQVKPALEDDNAPAWFDARAGVQVSQFNSWAEVADWALSINQPKTNIKGALADEIKTLKQEAGDNREKYFRSAVRMVQNEIRYMGIEIGPYSHRANNPEKVFDQRYGDCKDKSLLLVSMLQAGGIDAHMVLVNADLDEHIADYIPGCYAFNHAVVTANVSGKQVWVDATINDQGGEGTNIYFPNYGAGLVLKPGSQSLTTIPVHDAGRAVSEEIFRVKNVTSPVMFDVTTKYTLREADKTRDMLAATGMAEVEKNYLDYYAKIYSKIEPADTITVIDDEAGDVLTVREHYKITDYFKKDSASGKYEADFYAEGIRQQLPAITNQTKTPVAVTYPFNVEHTEKMILPSGWDLEPSHKEINRKAYRFSSDYSASGDTLSLNYKFSYLKGDVPVQKLDEFKEDIKQLMDKDLGYSVSVPGGGDDDGQPADFNQWMFNLALLLVLIMGVSAFFIYRTETPGIVFSYGSTFTPIGGWLVLVVIGLFLTPVLALVNLGDGNYFDQSAWTKLGTYTHAASLRWHFAFEMSGHLIFLCYSIFCLVLFLKKRDILPKYIIGYFVFGVIFNIANLVFFSSVAHVKTPGDYSTAIFRSVVVAAIWIPYFMVSTRVKETFIVPYPSYNYSYEGAEDAVESHQRRQP